MMNQIFVQRAAQEVCNEYFKPECQWKHIPANDVDKARKAIQENQPLLKDRDDIAHWFISKHQKSSSYRHVRIQALVGLCQQS